MSNKPLERVPGVPMASDGYELHDSSDPNCKRHQAAKRHKGIQPRPERVCPACVPESAEYTASTAKPVRKRRRATRPAA